MQIPVTITGENRSVTLGQILDALAATVVPFYGIDDTPGNRVQYSLGSTNFVSQRIVFDRPSGKFWAAVYNTISAAGQTSKSVVLYSEFANRDYYYDGDNTRTDCLFIDKDGRLYRYNGTALISAGLTDDQAELLRKLTPQAVASESDLEAMESAGEIVPGQIYYISENE